MEEARFIAWLSKDGEAVSEGQPLFTVEGDKATQEIEALDSGILRILPDAPRPGQEAPVGTLLAYLLAPGEELPGAGAARSAATAAPGGSAATPAAAAPRHPGGCRRSWRRLRTGDQPACAARGG